MSAFRYKAFVSYSHQDESNAIWLHHALESYRVPRRLVGHKGQFGPVPGKLTPVFRDREELSSATDLNVRITNALEESESLVVICSPASAQSHWVNEEVRCFRAMGRANRIFCIIVDGDPQSDETGKACFPPALLEHEDSLQHEPLAADIRKWADGKNLAKLKLIAGILGIRLDELRRRELQRKRKYQASGAVAVSIVLALAVYAFQSNMSVHRALEAQARNRENAENMLSQFIEATENLEQVVDLQTRKAFNDLASNFLQNLDPDDLTIESKRNLGKTFQKQGEISYDQGDYQSALQLFNDSRTILAAIYRENPLDEQAIFDQSQVEYYIGKLHFSEGRHEEAYQSFSAYRDASEKLVTVDPQNADWVMEMAYALSNLGYLEKNRSPPAFQNALEFYQAALDYAERAILLDETKRSELADFLADLADAWLGVCDLPRALSARVQAAQLAERYYLEDPANNRLKRARAFTLAGLANVQRLTGATGPALTNLQQSVDLLSQLYQEDRTKLQYRWNLLTKSDRAAHLMYLNGRTEEAWDWYLQLEDLGGALIEDDGDITLSHLHDYAGFLLNFSRVAFDEGEIQKAASLLKESTGRILETLGAYPQNHEATELLATANYILWIQNSESHRRSRTTPDGLKETELQQGPSCNEIDLRVRQAVMAGDLVRARQYSSMLKSKGFFEPEYMQFCRKFEVCG